METSSSNGNGDRLFLCGVFARSARASGGIDKSGGELYEHRCREAGVGGRIGDDVTDMRRDVAHVDGNCPAQDWPDTAKVDFYWDIRHTESKNDRLGVIYKGSIPQVAHTFAYLNTGYPV